MCNFVADLRKTMTENGDKDYGHVLKYTSLFGGVQGLIILIGLVRNKAMALLLGADGMGFNALLTSAQNFASQCTNLGISQGAVPRLSVYHEQQQTEQMAYFVQVIRLWSLLASLLGLVFGLAISPLINDLSFTWGNHTLHYALLAVSVAMMAITGGEVAILKATRRLGALARIQIATALAGVVISVPLFYYWRHTGVVPAIVLTSLAGMLFTVGYSYHYHPLRLHFERRMFRDGFEMLRLGVAFVLAVAIGSAAEMAVRSFLNVEGSMDDVGLYNAAFMITITYAGLVFSAMETDYFPRLSAVANDVEKTNETVNKQMEVSLLMLSPMLVALLMMLPVLIPMLFSQQFIAVTGMAQVAVLAMYFKVLTMPVAYITLARHRSLAFLFLETAYFAVFVAAIVVGFCQWGIYGTGIAIVVAHVAEFIFVNTYAYRCFSYRFSGAVALSAALQMMMGAAAFAVSLLTDGLLYWIAEAALVVTSTAYSVSVLRKKTHLWERLRKKLR